MVSPLSFKKNWYLGYTKPRQEQTAKQQLIQQQYEVMLPMGWFRRRRRQQMTMIQEPLFSRYLFIRLSDQHDDWGPIRSTRGMIHLVRFGVTTAIVPDSLVDYLLLKESECDTDLKAGHTLPFQKGDAVRIVGGVFEGYHAIFEAETREKRVTVLLNIIGKVSKLHLSSNFLECV